MQNESDASSSFCILHSSFIVFLPAVR